MEINNRILIKAKLMRADGWGWHRVCYFLGTTQRLLRPLLDPSYLAHTRAYRAAYNADRRQARALGKCQASKAPKRKQKQRPKEDVRTNHREQSAQFQPRVPQHVWAERERAMMAPRSLTALAFGDPPLGRSALDRRNV